MISQRVGFFVVKKFVIPCRTNINKIFYKVLSIGGWKSDIPAYLVTYVFVCHSTVYAGPSIGKKIQNYRHTPHLFDVIVAQHHYQYALVLQNIVCIMKVALPDQLAYHAYIIQAAALASAEHFYSQNGGKRAAMDSFEDCRLTPLQENSLSSFVVVVVVHIRHHADCCI